MSTANQSLVKRLNKTLDNFVLDESWVLDRSKLIEYFKSEVISTMGDFNEPYLVLFLLLSGRSKEKYIYRSYVIEKMRSVFILDKPEYILDGKKYHEFKNIIENGTENFTKTY